MSQNNLYKGFEVELFTDTSNSHIGVSAEILPESLLRELNKVSDQILEEEAAKDADFAEILASQRAFRTQYAEWKSRAYLPRDF